MILFTAEQFALWAKDLFEHGVPILKAALDLTERIFKEFKYDPSATTTSVETAFDIKRGACQDFAHI
ncbi:MAG: hypothetical protein HQK62_00475 [Desulfamplus sp.]|nr:hypothetical protein [Desulfamplus sp.]